MSTDHDAANSSPCTPCAPGSSPCALDPRVERTQAVVVGAAAELLLEHGPDAITHQHVAIAAGVSRTTVYKHWPERSDLLRAAVEAVDRGAQTQLPDHEHVRDDLRHLLGHLAGDLRDDGRAALIATLIERSQRDDAVAAVRDSMAVHIADTFDAVVARAVERGQLDPRVDASRALASLAGALLFTRLLANRSIDDDFVDALIDDFVTANTPR